MKILSFGDVDVAKEDEGRQIAAFCSHERSVLRRADRRPVRACDIGIAIWQIDRTTKILRLPISGGSRCNGQNQREERNAKRLHSQRAYGNSIGQKDHNRRRGNILECSLYQISSSGEKVISLAFADLPAKPLKNLEHILPDL